jgi:hypothetical protein
MLSRKKSQFKIYGVIIGMGVFLMATHAFGKESPRINGRAFIRPVAPARLLAPIGAFLARSAGRKALAAKLDDRGLLWRVQGMGKKLLRLQRRSNAHSGLRVDQVPLTQRDAGDISPARLRGITRNLDAIKERLSALPSSRLAGFQNTLKALVNVGERIRVSAGTYDRLTPRVSAGSKNGFAQYANSVVARQETANHQAKTAFEGAMAGVKSITEMIARP